jgi:hypothetical protein
MLEIDPITPAIGARISRLDFSGPIPPGVHDQIYRYCCGDDIDCTDSRCSRGGFICVPDTDGDGIPDLDDNRLALANGEGTGNVPISNTLASGGLPYCDSLELDPISERSRGRAVWSATFRR